MKEIIWMILFSTVFALNFREIAKEWQNKRFGWMGYHIFVAIAIVLAFACYMVADFVKHAIK